VAEGINHLVLHTGFVLNDKGILTNILNQPSMVRIDTRLRISVLKGFAFRIYDKFMREKVVSLMTKGLKQSV